MGLVPPTDPVTGKDNIVGLTTTIAAHELGHQSGLQHQDAFGPIGTGLYSGVSPTEFFPAYQGPQAPTRTSLTSSGSAGELHLHGRRQRQHRGHRHADRFGRFLRHNDEQGPRQRAAQRQQRHPGRAVVGGRRRTCAITATYGGNSADS